MTLHDRIDWPALVVALLMHKHRDGKRWGASRIAAVVGCDPSRIRQLRTEGTEPRHSLGVALIALHSEWVGPAPLQIAIKLRA